MAKGASLLQVWVNNRPVQSSKSFLAPGQYHDDLWLKHGDVTVLHGV